MSYDDSEIARLTHQYRARYLCVERVLPRPVHDSALVSTPQGNESDDTTVRASLYRDLKNDPDGLHVYAFLN